MILGIGVDIIEIDRIKKSVDQYGEQFLKKIFTKTELDYSLSKANKYQHLAARFAAKESIAKALSMGWDKSFNWKDIEIYNEPTGMPKVKLFGKLKEFLSDDKAIKITMSHSEHYVTCFAVLHYENNK